MKRSGSRPFWLLTLTLIELGFAIYIVAAIAPALGDLSPVSIPVSSSSASTTSTTTASTSTTSPTVPSGVAGGTSTTVTASSAIPVSGPSAIAAQQIRPVHVLGLDWKSPSAELLQLILVMVMAGIGASIHGLTSLTTFMGNKRFVPSWTAWYVIRMPVGVAIAVLLYFVVRAGFISVGTGDTSLNPYGLAALGGLAGMFSKQATDKLREVFDTALDAKADAQRKDKVDTVMQVDHITPASIPVGSVDRTVRVFGTNFFAATSAQVNGHSRPVLAHDSKQIAVTLAPEDVAKPGAVTVNLVGPGPSPAPSATIEVRVRPQISEIRANDDQDMSPQIIGVGFIDKSDVYIGDRKATVAARSQDGTSITVQVLQEDFDNRGTLAVSVRNPAGQGGESDPMPLSSTSHWLEP